MTHRQLSLTPEFGLELVVPGRQEKKLADRPDVASPLRSVLVTRLSLRRRTASR